MKSYRMLLALFFLEAPAPRLSPRHWPSGICRRNQTALANGMSGNGLAK